VAANIEVDVVAPAETNPNALAQDIVEDFGKEVQEAAQEVQDTAQEIMDKVEDVPAPADTNSNDGGEQPSSDPVAAQDSDESD